MNRESSENISERLRLDITKRLSPISPHIYNALETAQLVVPEIINVFEQHCGHSDHSPRIYRSLYPSLMRAIVQILLNSKEIKTKALTELDDKDALTIDWERLILSNNGLAGSFAGYNYRLLKGIKNISGSSTLPVTLPPPGHSSRKQRYYRQDHLLQRIMPLFGGDDVDGNAKHNVIYLWDNPTRDSVSLYLACPKSGTISKAEAYFIEPIEHPVLSVVPPVDVEDIMQELDLEKLRQDADIILDGDKNGDKDDTSDLWKQN